MLQSITLFLGAICLLIYLIRRKSSPDSDIDLIRGVRGHFVWGSYLNMDDVAADRTFGPTFIFRGLFHSKKLYVSDLTAASYILNHDTEFIRPLHEGRQLRPLFGNGLIIGKIGLFIDHEPVLRIPVTSPDVAHGEDHKRQVRCDA